VANWDDLDTAFDLPEGIEDRWRTLFEHLVARVRQETEHLPLNTMVQLQIERNLTLYVKIKQREAAPPGSPGGYPDQAIALDDNKFWLALTSALNDQVFKMKASDAKAARDEIMGRLKPVLAEFLQKLPDTHRERLRHDLVGMLDRVGL
jgi:hypothetical protein